MSIVIQNISEVYSREGEQEYIVKINSIPLASFTHVSEGGMAECLRKAAEALDHINVTQKIQQHQELMRGVRCGH